MNRPFALLAAALLACNGAGADPVRSDRASSDPAPGPAAVVAAAAAGPASPVTTPAALTIRILAVTSRSGGGDAILIADSAAVPARHLLIDAGDDGRVAAALRALGVASLDLVVLTHAHHDHYGGMDSVLGAAPARAFAFNGQVRTAATYLSLLEQVEREVPAVLVVDSLRRVRLGEGEDATVVTLIPPLAQFLTTDTSDGERINESSLAVRIERRGFSFLTTGDAERRANRHFVDSFGALVDVDVLKVGHHGSTDATQPFWLEATSPAVAVVSANGTTHPYAEVLQLLRGRGVELFCTPQHGTVTIRVAADGAYTIETETPPHVACQPGSSQ